MSRFTINNVLKQIEKHNNPFSFLITDNPQNNNYYDEKISTLEKDLKDIPDNKEKINYLNYFLENNISKEVNDLLSYYLQWKGIDEDKKSFIEKIKNDEGVISFIARIIKEDDYSGYKSYFESYILIYERILYFIENNDKPAINSETDKQYHENQWINKLCDGLECLSGKEDLLTKIILHYKDNHFIIPEMIDTNNKINVLNKKDKTKGSIVWLVSFFEVLESEKIIVNLTGKNKLHEHCERIYNFFECETKQYSIEVIKSTLKKPKYNKEGNRFNHANVETIRNDIKKLSV